MKLTEHFTLVEFTKSRTARVLGLDNIPGVEEIKNLKRLAEVMEIIREAAGGIPITPDSVYRSEAVNRAVGGESTSRHLRGLAIDFTIPGYTIEATINLIKGLDIPFHKVINEYGSWVHLSIPAEGEAAQRIALRKTRHGYDYC